MADMALNNSMTINTTFPKSRVSPTNSEFSFILLVIAIPWMMDHHGNGSNFNFPLDVSLRYHYSLSGASICQS